MPSTERLVDIVTPLGEALWFRQMTGTEALSIPFEYDVVFHASEKTPSLSAKAMLGKDVTLKVETEGSAGIRPFNGICTRFGNAGREGVHIVYTAKLRPWLWLASRRSDCKIFQHMTVPAIIDEVLAPYGHPWTKKLNRTYREWDYCVQYQETDMNFVMRLMEHEGIYFYFEHDVGSHTMVLIDDITRHSSLAGRSDIRYIGKDSSTVAREEHFNSWTVREEVDPGEYISIDYDFEHPKADLLINSKNDLGYSHADHERYEWPGGYTKHADGEAYAKLGMQYLQAEQERCQGHTTVRTMAPGYLFKLNNCPRKEQNREYLAVAATYFFRDNARMSEGSGEGDSDWGITVTSQPTTMPYRPQLLTPKPRTLGPQTAVVTGPPGEEIYVDKYSRVVVQFHWDRYGHKDHRSSCWIRVATPWAGEKWGMIHIPRIGQEVVVDFLNGDPDYPLITGSVYNADLMPPYALPANKTASGIKSRSTMGGGAADFNEIRMEDKKGEEQLYIHAQKNHDTVVELDESRTVGNNRQTRIENDDSRFVKGTDTHVVTKSQTNQIDGDQSTKVRGNQSLAVHGKQTITVGLNRTMNVEGDQNEEVHGNHFESISGDHNFAVTGTEHNTVQGDQVNKTGARSTFVYGNETTTVAGQTTLFSPGGYSVSAGAHYAETAMLRTSDITGLDTTDIKGGRLTTIKGVDTTSITGLHTHAVTGASVVSATLPMAISSPVSISVTGGVVTITGATAITLTAPVIALNAATSITLTAPTVVSPGVMMAPSMLAPLYTPNPTNKF